MPLSKIRWLFGIIDRSLFQINPPLNYDRTIEAITLLADMVNDCEPEDGDNSELWAIGEYGATNLESLIPGAYWFCVHYSGNEFSLEYACCCALGQIYSPGPIAKGPEPDSCESETYNALEQLLNESNKK